jgi:hypothetical protein
VEAGESGAMRVDAGLVREQLVAGVLAAARPRADALPQRAREELRGALRKLRAEEAEPPFQAAELGDRAARLGYACRGVELERFEPARRPIEWLAEELRARDGLELALELAGTEPDGRPDPGEAASWRVPGPGGHVRHYLAVDGAAQLIASGGEDGGELPKGIELVELKGCWMLGFFLHCCREASGEPA